MKGKVNLTYKQMQQVIGIVEHLHYGTGRLPEDFNNSAVISLIRACRDYCNSIADGKATCVPEIKDKHKESCRQTLIEKLDTLSIRYYDRF